MRTRTTPIRTGSKAKRTYDRAHLAWRAGAIASWYYGLRSPTDATTVWLIDGIEFDGKDLGAVVAAIDVAFEVAGVADAVFGESWCGYRSLHVTYTDGSRLTERYDATTGHVVGERATADAITADEAA
jgi:hypothetical protein